MPLTNKLSLGASVLAFCLTTGVVRAEKLDMQSYIPGSLPLLGKSGIDMAERVSKLTGGEVELVFQNPGELVTTGEIWDAVSTSTIPASWYTPGVTESVIPSATLFTAFPFGPDAVEYTAWWYNGGGQELWAEITAPYNIYTELCAMLAPEASGWFNKPINSPADLKGSKCVSLV